MLGEQWRKSASSNVDACVEVAVFASHVAVRNSTDPDGPVLVFTPREWRAFLDGVRAGEFNPAATASPRPLYPELADDLKRAGEQAARHKAGQP